VFILVLLFILVMILSTGLLTALGLNFLEAFTTVAVCISNMGPGLAMAGLQESYNEISVLGKWVLNFCMLFGRLEIYTFLLLLFPGFWRR
jgi:trk system potassium uptake protein